MSKQAIRSVEAFARELDAQIDRSNSIHEQQADRGEFRRVEEASSRSLRRGQSLTPQQEEETTYRFRLPEFVASSQLFLPENPDDRGARPLGGRSVNRPGPVTVSQHGRPVSQIEPSNSYDVDVSVHNGGDMYVPTGICELFRHPNKKRPDVEFKTDTLRFLLGNAMLTGTLTRGTISYGDHVRWIHDGHEYFMRVVGVIVLSEGAADKPGTRTLGSNHTTLLAEGHTRYKLWLNVGDLRPGMKQLDNGIGVLHDAPDYNVSERMFRLRVADAFRITGRGVTLTGVTEQGAPPPGETLFKIFTRKVPGERRRNNINSAKGAVQPGRGTGSSVTFAGKEWGFLGPGDLVVPVDPPSFTPTKRALPPPDARPAPPVFIDQQPFSLNGHDSDTVRFQIRTGPVGSDEWNAGHYRLIARVYSVHPVDLPAAADVFDPILERRVGDLVVEI